MKAKEEGRREGYQEGLRRGYQQARGISLVEGSLDVPPAGLGQLSNIIAGDPSEAQRGADVGRTDPLDDFSMMNLSRLPKLTIIITTVSSIHGISVYDQTAPPRHHSSSLLFLFPLNHGSMLKPYLIEPFPHGQLQDMDP